MGLTGLAKPDPFATSKFAREIGLPLTTPLILPKIYRPTGRCERLPTERPPMPSALAPQEYSVKIVPRRPNICRFRAVHCFQLFPWSLSQFPPSLSLWRARENKLTNRRISILFSISLSATQKVWAPISSTPIFPPISFHFR